MIEFIVFIAVVAALWLALEPAHRRALGQPGPGSDRARIRAELRAAQQHLSPSVSSR